MAARPNPLRAALAQINSTVGDIDGNAAKIAEAIERAKQAGAAIVVLPELALTGYPPEDLLLKTHFLDSAGAALERLAAEVHGIVALVGFPERADDVYNSAAVPAGLGGGAGRCGADREPVRVALPRRQGARPRADAGAARQGQPGHDPVL